MVSTLRQYGGGEHVATMSNLNPNYLELLWVELSWVELGLGFDNIKSNSNEPSTIDLQQFIVGAILH